MSDLNLQDLPITESDISDVIGRPIKSPIRIAALNHLGIEKEVFIDFFKDLFQELAWDPYDVRRLQIEFLKAQIPSAEEELNKLFKAYFTGEVGEEALEKWVEQLSDEDQFEYTKIKPWRRRSISQFVLSINDGDIEILREPCKQFSQSVDEEDYRSLPRIFEESPDKHVVNTHFNSLMISVFHIIQSIEENVKKIQLVAHFMSVKATEERVGDNSPEGAHEDGADYIISALVINRTNVKGGESQVIEKVGEEAEIIFRRTLQEGEFVFQADTGEEDTFGNDLWHHVTPFAIDDISKGEGWRDIIGFDINILE